MSDAGHTADNRADKPKVSIEDVGRVRIACGLARVAVPDALNAFKRILQVLEELDGLPDSHATLQGESEMP